MVTRPAGWLFQVAVVSLLPLGAALFVLGGSQTTSVAGLVLGGVALAGGAVAYSRGVLRYSLGVALAVMATGILSVVGLVAILAFLRSFPGQGGLTFINRTTVPIAVVDSGSRSIVTACSERTLRWSNTWGGNPATGAPHAEPLPAGAYVLSAENFRPAPDGVFAVTMVITRVRIVEAYEGMPDLRSLPCEGAPPALPSPSPSPSTR